jgi:hypothetical protein
VAEERNQGELHEQSTSVEEQILMDDAYTPTDAYADGCGRGRDAGEKIGEERGRDARHTRSDKVDFPIDFECEKAFYEDRELGEVLLGKSIEHLSQYYDGFHEGFYLGYVNAMLLAWEGRNPYAAPGATCHCGGNCVAE